MTRYQKRRISNRRSAVIVRERPQKKRVLFVKKLHSIFSSKTYFVIAVFLGSILLVGYFLFFTDQLLITKINIEGAASGTQQEIREYYDELSQQRKFFILKQNKTINFPVSFAQKDILFKIPKIKNAQITTQAPHTLNIKVQERSQEGIWCAYGFSAELPSCFFYDSQGVIYDDAPNSIKGSLIKVVRDSRTEGAELGSAVMDFELLEYIGNLVTTLEIQYELPSYIFIKNNDEISAGFSAGFVAQFSRSQDLQESVENLVLILASEIGNRASNLSYIDLRLGNKAFYKYKAAGE